MRERLSKHTNAFRIDFDYILARGAHGALNLIPMVFDDNQRWPIMTGPEALKPSSSALCYNWLFIIGLMIVLVRNSL